MIDFKSGNVSLTSTKTKNKTKSMKTYKVPAMIVVNANSPEEAIICAGDMQYYANVINEGESVGYMFLENKRCSEVTQDEELKYQFPHQPDCNCPICK